VILGRLPLRKTECANLAPLFGTFIDGFAAAIDRGLGEDVQMFHVYAVKAARDGGAELPLSWGQTAYRRMGLILQEGGFGNEQELLALALARWFDIWHEPALARQARKAVSWWRRLALWPWPGADWIPKPGAS
jgi:hypothetical protein